MYSIQHYVIKFVSDLRPHALVSLKKYIPSPLPYLIKEEEGGIYFLNETSACVKEEEGAYIFLMKQVPVLATGRWFSPGTLVFSTNKSDRHD